MKFDHRVKFKGVLYEIGQDVPMEENKAIENLNTKPQEVVAYTKTEINRMTTAELQDLAVKNGIDGAESITGAELKKILAEKFGL